MVIRNLKRDSLFVMMKGFSKNEAILKAHEIVGLINKGLPWPMELTFEKVYSPFIGFSKKRYCGLKFENLNTEGIFEAKGIELIRSDHCKLIKNIFQDLILISFFKRDLKFIVNYYDFLNKKINFGNFLLSDFIFYKKFRNRIGKTETITKCTVKKMLKEDRMSKPLNKERIKIVIIAENDLLREKGMHLDLFLLNEDNLSIDYHYYFNKNLKSVLSRLFGCLGFKERVINELFTTKIKIPFLKKKKKYRSSLITQYVVENCFICKKNNVVNIHLSTCKDCFKNLRIKFFQFEIEKKKIYKKFKGINNVCRNCDYYNYEICENNDCEIFYKKKILKNQILLNIKKDYKFQNIIFDY